MKKLSVFVALAYLVTAALFTNASATEVIKSIETVATKADVKDCKNDDGSTKPECKEEEDEQETQCDEQDKDQKPECEDH